MMKTGEFAFGGPYAAERLGCTIKQLHQKIWKLRHPPKRPRRTPDVEFWTVEKVKAFDALARNGKMLLSTERAAIILDANRHAIRRRMQRLGIVPMRPQRPFTDADKAFLRTHTDAYGQLDMSMGESVDALGCNFEPLHRLLGEMKIKPPPSYSFWTEAKIAAFMDLLNRNSTVSCSIDDAAARLGCNPATIVRALHQLANDEPLYEFGGPSLKAPE